MNLSNTFNQEVLAALRKGNTSILKGLPPVLVMQYGVALQNELGYKEASPINDQKVGKAMLDRMADSDVKERLVKHIEQEVQENTKEITG